MFNTRHRCLLGMLARWSMLNPRLAGLFVFLATSTHAQWLNHTTPGTPRTRDGKPNLAAKAPRSPNGTPDLSGVWQAEYAPPGEIERLFGRVQEVNRGDELGVRGDLERDARGERLDVVLGLRAERCDARYAPLDSMLVAHTI